MFLVVKLDGEALVKPDWDEDDLKAIAEEKQQVFDIVDEELVLELQSDGDFHEIATLQEEVAENEI